MTIMIACMLTFSAESQVTSAWSAQTGNLVGNSAMGAVSFHKYEGVNLTSQGGIQTDAPCNLTLVINESQEILSFVAYPNPTNGLVFTDIPEGTAIGVYNMQGSLINTTIDGNIDLSDLSPGTYIIGATGFSSTMVVKF